MKRIKYLFVLLFILGFAFLVGCGESEGNKENGKDDTSKGKLYVECVFNNGEENKVIEVTENEFVPEAPTREGYDFVKWYTDEELTEEFDLFDVDINLLTSDVKVYAYAKWRVLRFTVEFYSDEVRLSKQTIDYGQSAKAPQALEKDGMRFDHWDADYTSVKSDLKIKAVYVARPLKITYYDNNGKTVIEGLELTTYMAGSTYELPTYTKEGYEFEGWYLSPISLYPITQIESYYKGDLKIYARFTELVPHEEFKLPEAKYHFTGIRKSAAGNNTFTYQPIFPSGANSDTQAYDWTVSDDMLARVSSWSSITPVNAGYSVVTATLKTDKTYTVNCIIRTCPDGVFYATEEEANKITTYKVTFVDDNDNVIKEQRVQEGGHAIAPVPTEKSGYAFSGWDKAFYNIKADTIVKATYKEGGMNNYVGKKVTIIGDSITTYYGMIPTGYSFFYPYPTGDTFDVQQTWWMRTINALGALLLVDNAYSGSCVAYGGASATNSDTRVNASVVQSEKPDVIIIYMGSNDAASSAVNASLFKQEYKVMLDKLIALCPDAEIILMELPKSKLYSDASQQSFNKVIDDYAAQYNLKYIDCKEVDITTTLIDSAHPFNTGMELIANNIISQLTK